MQEVILFATFKSARDFHSFGLKQNIFFLKRDISHKLTMEKAFFGGKKSISGALKSHDLYFA